jgi:ribosomal protein S18 acetylase RimI-like enzyme
MNEIIIRRASLADAEGLSKLNFAFNQIERSAEAVESCLNNNAEIVVVAESNNTIVGFGCAQMSRSFCYNHLSGEITEMFVSPSFRRAGVASLLLHELERILLEHDVDAIKILIGTSNESAKIAYQKKGYRLKTSLLLQKIFSPERKNSTH